MENPKLLSYYYNRLLAELPEDSHPGFHSMKRIPGRQSIIAIVAAIVILDMQRTVRQLREPHRSTQDIDVTIAEFEQHKEESMSRTQRLTKAVNREEDNWRLDQLAAQLPADYPKSGHKLTLVSAKTYIWNLEDLINTLESNVLDCREMLGDLDACDRPYCPSCKFQRSRSRSVVPTTMDVDDDSLDTDEDNSDLDDDVGDFVMAAMQRHMMREYEDAVKEGRELSFPPAGSLTSAYSTIYQADNGLQPSGFDLMLATATVKQFTDDLFANGADECLYALR